MGGATGAATLATALSSLGEPVVAAIVTEYHTHRLKREWSGNGRNECENEGKKKSRDGLTCCQPEVGRKRTLLSSNSREKTKRKKAEFRGFLRKLLAGQSEAELRACPARR